MYVFLDAGNANVLALFELPDSPSMGRDERRPPWVQHIAFKAPDLETLLPAKARLEVRGVEVVGPTDHELFQPICSFDPDGRRIELAAGTATPEALARLRELGPATREEWTETRRLVCRAAWSHEREFAHLPVGSR